VPVQIVMGTLGVLYGTAAVSVLTCIVLPRMLARSLSNAGRFFRPRLIIRPQRFILPRLRPFPTRYSPSYARSPAFQGFPNRVWMFYHLTASIQFSSWAMACGWAQLPQVEYSQY